MGRGLCWCKAPDFGSFAAGTAAPARIGLLTESGEHGKLSAIFFL